MQLKINNYTLHINLRLNQFFHLFHCSLPLWFPLNTVVWEISSSYINFSLMISTFYPLSTLRDCLCFICRSVYNIQLSLFCYLSRFIHEFSSSSSNSRILSGSDLFPSFPASQPLQESPVNHSIGLLLLLSIFSLQALFILYTYHILFIL